jgi:hypothetical protein
LAMGIDSVGKASDQVNSKVSMLGEGFQSAANKAKELSMNLKLIPIKPSPVMFGPSVGAPLPSSPSVSISVPGFDEELKYREELSRGYVDLIERQNREIRQDWEYTNDRIADSFIDSLTDMTHRGVKPFEAFFETVKGLATRSFMQAFAQPFTQPLFNALSSMIVPPGFVGPLTPAQSAMQQYAPMIGAGAMGYGMGGMGGLFGGMGGYMAGSSLLGGLGIFAKGGALAGMAGPVGMIGGVIVTSALQNIIDGLNKEKPGKVNIDLLFETIDDQVRLVSDSWKGTSKSMELVFAIETMLQDQIDFYNSLRGLTGHKAAGVSYEFSIDGDQSNFASLGADYVKAIPLLQLLKNLPSITQIGGVSSRSDVQKLFSQIFGDIPSGGPGTIPGTSTPILGGVQSGVMPSEEIKKILGLQDPQKMVDEVLKWLGSSITYAYRKIPSDISVQYGTKSINPLEMYSDTDSQIIDKFLEEFKQKSDAFQNFLGPAIGDGLNSVFQTRQFATFEQTLRNNMAASIGEAIKQGFITNELMPVLFAPFGEQLDAAGNVTRASLVDTLNKYTSGNMTLDQAMGNITGMGNDLGAAITATSPLVEKLIGVMDGINVALGANTQATQSNTSTLAGTGGTIDAFISRLTGSDLSPGPMSLAAINSQYSGLLAQSRLDSSYLPGLMSNIESSYLPWAKGVSENYGGVFNSTISDLEGLKSVYTAPGYYDDPVQAEAVSRSRAISTGSGSISDNNRDLARSIAAELAPMLLDLSEKVITEKQIRG